MKFSARTAWELEENEFARTVRQIRETRAADQPLLDLTVSNPTTCGFTYDAESLLAPLADPQALIYEPDALGMPRGREAVAAYYAEQGITAPIANICLTTSTSEAYSFLFRLLCDPGDEVLVARPSYPLFDFIAKLDHVTLVEYPLLYSEGWHIDFAALEASITPRTRAIVVVHPNNPSGNFVSAAERLALDALCARHNLALLVDEVFLDYAWPPHQATSFAATTPQALTFILSGLSKVCALPQMKISWIVATGPTDLVHAAMQRVEVIADTFLSVNAPMQFALSAWLRMRHALQSQIQLRCAENRATLDRLTAGTEVTRLHGEGGWTAVLRVPRETFLHDALERGVIIQPGEFYGLPPGRAVVSLLTPPSIWLQGFTRILNP